MITQVRLKTLNNQIRQILEKEGEYNVTLVLKLEDATLNKDKRTKSFFSKSGKVPDVYEFIKNESTVGMALLREVLPKATRDAPELTIRVIRRLKFDQNLYADYDVKRRGMLKLFGFGRKYITGEIRGDIISKEASTPGRRLTIIINFVVE